MRLVALLVLLLFATAATAAPAPVPRPERHKEKPAQALQPANPVDTFEAVQVQNGQVWALRVNGQQAQVRVRVWRVAQVPPPAPPK
jgi:hypothetical protein